MDSCIEDVKFSIEKIILDVSILHENSYDDFLIELLNKLKHFLNNLDKIDLNSDDNDLNSERIINSDEKKILDEINSKISQKINELSKNSTLNSFYLLEINRRLYWFLENYSSFSACDSLLGSRSYSRRLVRK